MDVLCDKIFTDFLSCLKKRNLILCKKITCTMYSIAVQLGNMPFQPIMLCKLPIF